MKRRAAFDVACQRCQRKRTKCDGKRPCQSCRAATEDCEYRESKFASKGQLRAEIEHLRRIVDENEARASESSEGSSTNSGKDKMTWARASPSTNMSSMNPDTDSDISQPFDDLISWKISRPQSARSADAFVGSLRLTPLPHKQWTKDSIADSWTETGWSQAHVLDLFDITTTWDYVPIGLLERRLFLQDYEANSTRYCSKSLVHAILALSTLLLSGNDDDSHGVPARSRQLLQVAETLLRAENTQQPLLPDIQALGFMAFYQLRCGREAEAHLLAETMLNQINTLYSQGSAHPALDDDEGDYAKALITTYRGAVSLTRILYLATGRYFNLPKQTLAANSKLTFQCFSEKSVLGSTKDSDPSRQSHDAQFVTELLFQLIEWMFALSLRDLSSPEEAIEAARTFYIRSLDWYEELFTILNQESNRTPLVIFVHMCYHFLLLCAFRPLITRRLDANTELEVISVCTKAARSVLSLVQSYDDLFTLQRVPTLMPYIVLATAFFGSALEGTNLEIASTHRPPLTEQFAIMTQIKSGQQEFELNPGRAEDSPATKFTIVNHARLKLRKMGRTHSMALVAESKLK